MHPSTGRRGFFVTLLVAVSLVLIGCGVSGKPSSAAQPTSTAPKPSSATTPPTSADASPPATDSTVPETTAPDTGDTTIPTEPTTSDTTTPAPGSPFGSGEIKRTLIRIYKQSGFTDKEANCVADLIVKNSGGGTFDPSKLDVTKLGAAARRCFGADGVPGGSD